MKMFAIISGPPLYYVIITQWYVLRNDYVLLFVEKWIAVIASLLVLERIFEDFRKFFDLLHLFSTRFRSVDSLMDDSELTQSLTFRENYFFSCSKYTDLDFKGRILGLKNPPDHKMLWKLTVRTWADLYIDLGYKTSGIMPVIIRIIPNYGQKMVKFVVKLWSVIDDSQVVWG